MSTWRCLRDAARARIGDDQEIRWMIERASGMTAAEQVVALDQVPTSRHAGSFAAMIDRREAGEPLQYVLGNWGFRTLDLFVDHRVLIPRPETEVVAGLAVAALPDGSCCAVDLGTGSGAIALSLAVERWPDVAVWATDVSSDALAVARANAAALGRRATQVRLVAGDWFAALPAELQGSFDVVVANPPYVPDGALVARQVRDHEPAVALYGGPDGLDHVRRIVTDAPAWLAPGGTLIVEIGETQADAVVELAIATGLVAVRVEPDLAGRPRALVAHQP